MGKDTTPRCENGHRNPFNTPCQAGKGSGGNSGSGSGGGSKSSGGGKSGK